MFDFKTILVEKETECPLCDRELKIGDIMYRDEDRAETLCCYCKEDYKKEVILEEGEDGRLLK